MYASFLGMSEALHMGILRQPPQNRVVGQPGGRDMNKKWMFIIGPIALHIAIAWGVCLAEEEKGHEEHFGPHRIELLLGNTHDDGENGFTIGVGYEYRISPLVGVGGLIESVTGEDREWILLVPVLFHPYKGWRFLLGPGFEGNRTKDNEFVFRVGAAYEFEIGRWAIAPQFNLDFVDNRKVPVFGVSFVYAF